MIEIPLPRLLDNTGAEIRRITPLHAAVTLDKTPLSTASLELPAGEKLNNRAWVEMYTINGSAGIYRVVSPQTGYGDQTGAADLEHGAAEIGDSIVSTPTSGTYTAGVAFQTLFGFYKGTHWRLGTVEATGSIAGDWDGENVLEAMVALLEQIPGYHLEFVQTTTPWTVNVRKDPTVVSAEGRLDRNVINATVSEDGSSQVTRLYMEGLPNGYVEADNISQEGTIEKFLAGGGDDLTPESITQLEADARRYIEQHKNPLRSVQISGYDFYALTGESLDKLELCKLYRLELPEDNVTISANISSLSFDDVYGSPYSVSITLDEQEYGITTALSHLERVAGGGSGGQRRQKEEEKKFKQFETFYTQTDEKFSWLATDSEWDELAQAGHVTAYTELTRTAHFVEDTAAKELPYEDWKAQTQAVDPTADVSEAAYRAWITANPYAIYNNVYSDSTRTERIISKTGINSLGGNETLASRIGQEADRITQIVQAVGSNGEVTAASIVAAVNGSGSSVVIDADHIDLNGIVTATEFETAIASLDHVIGDFDVHGNVDVGGTLGAGTINCEGTIECASLDVNGVVVGSVALSNLVNDIGPASASGGKISIPWTKLDGSSGSVNFNIADYVSALIVDGNDNPVSGPRTLAGGGTLTLYPATYMGGVTARNAPAALVITAADGADTVTLASYHTGEGSQGATTDEIKFLDKTQSGNALDVRVGVRLSNGKQYSRTITGISFTPPSPSVGNWQINSLAGGGTRVWVDVNGTTYHHDFNNYP